MKSQPRAAGKAASKLISERIAELGDWNVRRAIDIHEGEAIDAKAFTHVSHASRRNAAS